MGCRVVLDGPGVTAIACSRGSSRRVACSTPGCTGTAVARCDWPLTGPKAGETCGRAMCAQCRRSQAPDVDYCQAHHALAKANDTTKT